MRSIISIEDFSSTEPNCGNCTRRGGFCERSRVQKNIVNGFITGLTGECGGLIYRCIHYTGNVLSNVTAPSMF